MAIWSIFKRNKHVIPAEQQEEMQRRSLETRQLKHQIEQLEKRLEMKAHLADISSAISGNSDGGDNQMMTLLAPLLLSFLSGKQQANSDYPSQFVGSPLKNGTNSQIDVAKCNLIVNTLNQKTPKSYIEQLKNFTDGEILYIKDKLIEVNLT